MSTTEKSTTLRWGIVSTGWISTKFSLDLLIPTSTRGASSINHVITAVAARELSSVDRFLEKVWTEASENEGVVHSSEEVGRRQSMKEKVAKYGSYQELFDSDSCDIIYIGTPHSHHYRNAHAALTAGKHVLCEKSLTVNADQAKALVELAKKKQLFFMEAVWTRFQPVAYKVQELIKQGTIGQLKNVQAELSIDFEKNKEDLAHRMISPDLAGGALLDLGPYPWTWLALLLLPSLPLDQKYKPLELVASMTKTPNTGVDQSTVAVIKFPQADGRIIHGTLTCALDSQTPGKRCVLVEGSLGFLEIQWATYRPESISYSTWKSIAEYNSGSVTPDKSESISFATRPGGAWGFIWEADECARCIRDGKLESERMPTNQTILMMETFDEIRKQGQLIYPESIECLDL